MLYPVNHNHYLHPLLLLEYYIKLIKCYISAIRISLLTEKQTGKQNFGIFLLNHLQQYQRCAALRCAELDIQNNYATLA